MPKPEEKKKKRRGDQFGSPLYTYIFINLNIKKLERINISLYDNSGLGHSRVVCTGDNISIYLACT